MIQCVEQRNAERPYCSRVCCTTAVKNALELARTLSRRPGSWCSTATCGPTGSARRPTARPGRRACCSSATSRSSRRNWTLNGRLQLRVREPSLGRDLELEPDLVVLAAPMVPRADRSELSELLRVPLNADGFFLEAHMKLRPVDFASEGLFLCGTAHAPKFLSETIAQANAVAGRAASILAAKTDARRRPDRLGRSGQVHLLHDLRPRLPVHGPADQRVQQGRGAGGHVHGLRQLHGRVPGQGDHAAALRRRPDSGRGRTACWAASAERKTPELAYPEQVGRCPAAMAWCKSRSRDRKRVNPDGIDEPLILAFCCHYCAYAAADLAGSMRLQYPEQRPRAAAALHGQARSELPAGGLRARRRRRDRGRLPGRRLPLPRRQPARPAAGRAGPDSCWPRSAWSRSGWRCSTSPRPRGRGLPKS